MAEPRILPEGLPLDNEPINKWRAVAVVVGLAMMLLGGAGGYFGPSPPAPGTTNITIVLRAAVPAGAGQNENPPHSAEPVAGSSAWRVVPPGDPSQPGDATIVVELVTTRTRVGNSGPAGSRLMRGTDFPPATTVKATLKPQEPPQGSPTRRAEKGGDDYARLSLIADEVESRTGYPVMAMAVRRTPETVEFEPGTRWIWWSISFCGGTLALLASGLIRLPH